MLLAVRWRCVTLKVEDRSHFAAVMCTTLAFDVYHVVLSMLLAVRRRSALEIEGRPLEARFVQTPLASDVHHAIVSMLHAVHRRLASLEVIPRWIYTGLM